MPNGIVGYSESQEQVLYFDLQWQTVPKASVEGSYITPLSYQQACISMWIFNMFSTADKCTHYFFYGLSENGTYCFVCGCIR